MTNRGADFEPRAIVANHVEEVQRRDIRYRHDGHEQCARSDFKAFVEDAKIGADDGKRDHQFQNEEGTLTERIKNGDEAVDAVKGEGGDRGNVACAEERG